jgi:hypothetical protein
MNGETNVYRLLRSTHQKSPPNEEGTRHSMHGSEVRGIILTI